MKQIFVEPAISYQIGPGIMPTQACAGPFRPRVVDRSHRKGKTRRRRRRFCCELSTIGAEKATKPFVKWRIQPIDGYFPWTVSRSVGRPNRSFGSRVLSDVEYLCLNLNYLTETRKRRLEQPKMKLLIKVFAILKIATGSVDRDADNKSNDDVWGKMEGGWM